MTAKRVSTMAIQIGQRVLFADVEYFLLPSKPESFTDPGHPAEVELLDVIRDGTSIIHLMTAKEVRDVEIEIEECYEQAEY